MHFFHYPMVNPLGSGSFKVVSWVGVFWIRPLELNLD